MPSKSHMEYAKLKGEKGEKTKHQIQIKKVGFVEKIINLIKKKPNKEKTYKEKTYKDDKIYELIDSSINAFKSTENAKSAFLREFDEYLSLNKKHINQTKSFKSYQKKLHRRYNLNKLDVFRSPLEYAIERNAPLEVMMMLLKNGAEPSNTSCSMAMLYLCSKVDNGEVGITIGENDVMDTEKNKKLIELLSFAGADWSKPCGEFHDKVKGDHPSGNIKSPLADFIVEKLGEEESYEIGVKALEHEKYEIDLDEFAKKIQNLRIKREKNTMENKNHGNLMEDKIEILIPEKVKPRWKNN